MQPVRLAFDGGSDNRRPLLLDGAIGSLLQSRGLKPHPLLWMSHAVKENPELIRNIHIEYINSGADIITTNTFRTNPSVLLGSIYKSEELVKDAVRLASEAASIKPGILIAGSNAPAEDCYQSERTLSKNALISNHHEHIDHLINSGCSFILNETQGHLDEINIICRYCNSNNIPYIISLFFTDDLKLLSGEYISDAVDLAKCFNPIAISFNCIHITTFQKFISSFNPEYNWGFYLNIGAGNYNDEQIACSINDLEYLEHIKQYFRYNPSFIGACCGSSPSHIRKIREYIDELYRN